MNDTLPLTASPAPLYLVTLRGAPEIFSERRRDLEERVRHLIDQQYGGEAAASAALHNYLDAGDQEDRWPQVVEFALQIVGTQLPPGATFDFGLNWDALSGPIEDFSVQLRGAPDLPYQERREAERAYYRHLCAALGDPVGVMRAHSAIVNAVEAGDDAAWHAAKKIYDKAETAARTAALEGLRGASEATFWCSFFAGAHEAPAAWPRTEAPF